MTEKTTLASGRRDKHKAILHIDVVADMITVTFSPYPNKYYFPAFFPVWQHAVAEKPD